MATKTTYLYWPSDDLPVLFGHFENNDQDPRGSEMSKRALRRKKSCWGCCSRQRRYNSLDTIDGSKNKISSRGGGR